MSKNGGNYAEYHNFKDVTHNNLHSLLNKTDKNI